MTDRTAALAETLCDDVEYVARALYECWPFTAFSPALQELTGLPEGAVISWEKSIELGADHRGLRRLAAAAVAAIKVRRT